MGTFGAETMAVGVGRRKFGRQNGEVRERGARGGAMRGGEK